MIIPAARHIYNVNPYELNLRMKMNGFDRIIEMRCWRHTTTGGLHDSSGCWETKSRNVLITLLDSPDRTCKSSLILESAVFDFYREENN